MARKNIGQEVAENIGKNLADEEVLAILAENLVKSRLGDLFRPIVRQALAEAEELDPEQIGPELVEEGVQQGITAGYLATKWLEERIPLVASELQAKFAETYEGFENEEAASRVARNYLIVRDEDLILANAVSDGLLKKKS